MKKALPQESFFSLLMIATCQGTDDFRASIVDLAQWCNLRRDFRFDFLSDAKVATFKHGSLGLVWLEEVADFLCNQIWFGILMAEEHVKSNVLQIGIDMKRKMTVCQQGNQDIMIIGKLLDIQIDELMTDTRQRIFQILLNKFYVSEFIVFAVE